MLELGKCLNWFFWSYSRSLYLIDSRKFNFLMISDDQTLTTNALEIQKSILNETIFLHSIDDTDTWSILNCKPYVSAERLENHWRMNFLIYHEKFFETIDSKIYKYIPTINQCPALFFIFHFIPMRISLNWMWFSEFYHRSLIFHSYKCIL